ncbi:MAG: hypothetical protein V4714_21345 [Bacteroidota bacterium]
MRYFLFEKIQSEDNLALLLNAYAEGLSMMESLSMPRESMREYKRSWELEIGDALHPASRIERYYELSILSNSLQGVHRSVTGAIALLTTFFSEFEADLQHYAITNRTRVIEEYGSDDPTDWDDNDNIVFKDDAESLKSYTLYSDLAQYFGQSGTHGEDIGSSAAEDFAHLTLMVARQTDFSIAKFFRSQGNDVPLYRANEEGEMQPMTLADEVESELNADLINAHVAQYFEEAMTLGVSIRQYFELMPQDEPKAYLDLLTQLRQMLAVRCD